MTSSSSVTARSTGIGSGASYRIAGVKTAGTCTLLACGAVAGPPLLVTAVVAQALTGPGFSLTRDAASLLDDGPWGDGPEHHRP